MESSPARDFFANLGPGLITGAADDDPSGISTHSVAGATFGYAPHFGQHSSPSRLRQRSNSCALGWLSSTGRGLASVIQRRYPRWCSGGACLLLIAAKNVINIVADLGGMAQATQLVTGINALIWNPIYTVGRLWKSGKLLLA